MLLSLLASELVPHSRTAQNRLSMWHSLASTDQWRSPSCNLNASRLVRVFNVKTARRGGRDLHTACHDGRFRLGCIDSVAGNKKQMFRLQNLVSNFEKCKSFFDLESANINKPFFKSTKIWLMKGSHTVLLSDSFSYFLPHIRILAMIL